MGIRNSDLIHAHINFSAVIPLYFTNPRAANGAAPKIHTHDTVSDNRNLHISGLLNEGKVDIQDRKVDIENEKVDIQDEKVDIESVLSEKGSAFSVKTTVHIHRLFEEFGFDEVFGRSAVMKLLELKGSGASKLLSNLVQAEIIEPVSGYGKGKYKFKR